MFGHTGFHVLQDLAALYSIVSGYGQHNICIIGQIDLHILIFHKGIQPLGIIHIYNMKILNQGPAVFVVAGDRNDPVKTVDPQLQGRVYIYTDKSRRRKEQPGASPDKDRQRADCRSGKFPKRRGLILFLKVYLFKKIRS